MKFFLMSTKNLTEYNAAKSYALKCTDLNLFWGSLSYKVST